MTRFARLLSIVLALVALAWPGVAAEHPPVVVGLALDSSGSLRAEDRDTARQLVEALVARLPQGSEVAVFTFDDQSRVVQERTADLDQVRAALGRLAPAGRFTALHDAIYDVSRYLYDAPGQRNAIVLITDGKDENSAVRIDDGLKVAVDAGIPVFAVGVGRVEERALRRVAKLTGGEYSPARGADGADIARRILAMPETHRPQPAEAVDAAVSTRPGATTAQTGAAVTPAVPASDGGATRRALLWLLVVVLALAAGGLVYLALSRRPEPARCATCGRPLASPLASCTVCAAEEATTRMAAASFEPESPPERRRPEGVLDGLSPTVIEHLNTTEEFLERTVTLREKPVLGVMRGPGAGQVYDLSFETTTSLGRSRANDIVVPDVAVSSQHCRVRPEDGAFVLFDLESTNGTFVNERQVTRHTLSEGDVIRLGETYLQFRREQHIH